MLKYMNNIKLLVALSDNKLFYAIVYDLILLQLHRVQVGPNQGGVFPI